MNFAVREMSADYWGYYKSDDRGMTGDAYLNYACGCNEGDLAVD